MRNFNQNVKFDSSNKSKKKWKKPVFIFLGIVLLFVALAMWKTGFILNKISSDGTGGLLSSLTHALPGVKDELEGEQEGRINVLLMGMRRADDPAGGNLADTIMVASIAPKTNKISLVSIPRDLYVKNPSTGTNTKINAVHAFGERDKKGQGMKNMEQVVGEISGLKINYAMTINFEGFKSLIDTLGGVQIHLDSAFSEPVQFMGVTARCDDTNFTVPSGKTEEKTHRRANGSIATQHFALCYAKTASECGGNFQLDAGDLTLNGDQALCYVRSRDTTSDFDRAKRQQVILQKIQDKATSLGTLSDFSKVNGMMDDLGDNVKTDMQAWELKRLYSLYKEMQTPQISQKVLENTEEGLLYAPESTPETGYILLPRGDNYDKIHALFQNILPAVTAETNSKK